MSANRSFWRRPQPKDEGIGAPSRLMVVTDVDKSLLEPGTRSLADERAALDLLAARGIPLVINSSRTRAEIERLHQTLRLLTPFICEQGSALFLPHGCLPGLPPRAQPAVGGHVIPFGPRYHEVVDGLRLACRETRIDVVSFAGLSIDEVAGELGVASVEAQLAKLREYTELFRFVDESETTRSRLFRALRKRGLRCWRRGRHQLVTAAPNRAESLRLLKTLWQDAWGPHVVIGLGDSDDDIGWLQDVDVAVIVPDPRSGVPARLLSRLPTVRVAKWPGRRGWSQAVSEIVGALAGAADRKSSAPAAQSGLRSQSLRP